MPARLFFLGFLLGAPWLLGQTVASTLTGRLTDPTGAVVPGAKVRVVNEQTGVGIPTESNEAGLYHVGSLSPGTYRVEVEAGGFQRLVRRDIVLQVSQVLQVDLVLQVGQVTETVEVTGAAPVIEAQSSSVGQLVERTMIEGMPLPNRAATALVVLSPAAAVISQGGGGENLPIFSVAGGRARNQNYTLDGGNVTNVVGLAVPQQQTSLPMDAMQEFRIVSNNYAAEYGHSTGGIVTLSTRAGTNELHGSLFEYARNDAFDARNFFAATKAPLRLHQLGGSLGGPVRKDKTHFFASWEHTRQITGGPAIQTVPETLQRGGDFSGTRDAAGRMIVIYDPATTTAGNVRQPFPGNRIPAERIDPVAKAVAAFWPAPNRPGAVTGANNFAANSRPEFTRNIVVARVDHQLRPSDQLTARYYINDNQDLNPGVHARPESDPSAGVTKGRTQSILGTHSHLFGSRMVNEVRFSFVRRFHNPRRFGFDKDFAGQLGLKGVSDKAFPIFSVTGYVGLGGSPFRLQSPIQDTQFQDALSWYRGRHALKTGFEYRRGFNRDDTDTSSSGNVGFTALITGQPGVANTGNAFASFLLGEANSASIVRPDPIGSHASYWALYVQDDWRATDRLTLNFGLRWELGMPRITDEDRMNAFDMAKINPVSGTPGVITFAGRDGVPRRAWDPDYNNFGPRFGFAWRVPALGATVVRGGAGIFYGPTVAAIVATAAALGFSTDVSLVATQPGINSAMRLREGFPAIRRPPVAELGAGFGAVRVGENPRTAVTFFERARPNPIAFQYNLNVQHEPRQNLLVEAGYLANISHRLTAGDLTLNQAPPDRMGPGNAQVRRPFPQFSNVSVVNPPVGNSTYHALYLKSEKRYAAGLTFLAHFTFSKFIDDVASFSEYGDPGSYMDAYNRRLDKSLSGNDVRHRAVVSAVYELPFFRGQGGISAILGGWKTGLLVSLQSGPPFTVYMSTNTTNAFSAGALRPDLVGKPQLGKDERTLARWFNTGAFRAPASYRFGDSPRSVLRGPGINNVDLSLLKTFSLRESWKAEFRGEFYNFINHANFGLPAHSLGVPAFGIVSSARASRTIQLGLRVSF
ncbi:MAG: carboxypeptidase regulatory-like domain-containing protein [Acidobacteriota bacterium]